MTPKFPHVKVDLAGQDGNAFAILARTKSAMRKAKVSEDDISEMVNKATSGDYNNLLRVVMETVDAH